MEPYWQYIFVVKFVFFKKATKNDEIFKSSLVETYFYESYWIEILNWIEQTKLTYQRFSSDATNSS